MTPGTRRRLFGPRHSALECPLPHTADTGDVWLCACARTWRFTWRPAAGGGYVGWWRQTWTSYATSWLRWRLQ